MAFDAATLIRAGSGIAFAAVGLLALWKGPRRGRIALGTACLAFGLGFGVVNFFAFGGRTAADVAAIVQSVLFLLFAGALDWYLLFGPWSDEAGARREFRIASLAAAIVSAVTVMMSLQTLPAVLELYRSYGIDFGDGAGAFDVVATQIGAVFVLLFAAGAARHAGRQHDARKTRVLALLALGFSAYVCYNNAGWLTAPYVGFAFSYIAAAITLVVPLAWIPIMRRPGGRWAVLVAWGSLLAMLIGLAEPLVLGSSLTSTVGVVRTLAALAVGMALLGGGLDDGVATPKRLPRSALAAGALALLFIVAQIAQNFLAAQYGLLMGGVVAGTFLFAASPVQRAMERFGERKPARGGRTMGAPPKQQESAFRDAVRLAWKDRRFQQDEEVALANLADSLGLTAKRATELRHEVERERGLA